MIVKLRLEISDQQRNTLAKWLTGKEIKRLASREEVANFVTDCLMMLDVSPPEKETGSEIQELTTDEQRIARELREAGKPETYITAYLRGWRSVNRVPKSNAKASTRLD